MAIDTRYQMIDNLPEEGIQLACGPAMYNYSEVLKEAWQNNASLNGGISYNESDKPTREISYVYALNSIYRDLLKWQNSPENDEEVINLRQEIREMFPYFMNNEFPLPEDAAEPNFEINDDCIQINTKNPLTKEIIDPQSFELDPAYKQRLDEFMGKLDSLLTERTPRRQNAPSNASTPENGNERFQEKSEYFNKRLRVSADFIRKMQFFIARKVQGKEVHDFRTTEEKARTFRNSFIDLIEGMLQPQKNKDISFTQSSQSFSNFLDSNGMQLVWYQEPPYEAEFVNHLDAMKQDLIAATPPEFYNTKLPVFLDLCKNLHEFSPQKTAPLQAMLQDFLNAPSKPKLITTIDEAKRISLELQEIDRAKSKSMRAAWNGLISCPSKKQLSPFLQDILLIRNYVGNKTASAEMQKKVAAYSATQYKKEDYDFSRCTIWNICKKVPQFRQLQNVFFNRVTTIGIPPEKLTELTYDDIAYLLNDSIYSRASSLNKSEGISVRSDKVSYFKNFVKNHEKELRKSLNKYYQQKFSMQLINNGIAYNKSDSRIQKKVETNAAQVTEKIISDLSKGYFKKYLSGHHLYNLSNISYFEQVTGKSFNHINDYVVMINNDFHDLIHLNENNVDYNGRICMDKDTSHRTKYILSPNVLREGDRITGYIGRAFSFAIMPKPGIKAMLDFRSFIFDKEMHLKNMEVQQQLIDLRKSRKNKFNLLTIPHMPLQRLGEFLQNLLQPAPIVELNNAVELQKARELDQMNQQRHIENVQIVDKTPRSQTTPPSFKFKKFSAWRQNNKQQGNKR